MITINLLGYPVGKDSLIHYDGRIVPAGTIGYIVDLVKVEIERILVGFNEWTHNLIVERCFKVVDGLLKVVNTFDIAHIEYAQTGKIRITFLYKDPHYVLESYVTPTFFTIKK